MRRHTYVYDTINNKIYPSIKEYMKTVPYSYTTIRLILDCKKTVKNVDVIRISELATQMGISTDEMINVLIDNGATYDR